MHTPCQLCGKRAATTHLTELAQDGGKRELHLCGSCVQGIGVQLQEGPPSIETMLEKAGSDTSPSDGQAVVVETVETDDLTCPSCHLSFSEYTANNLFGCSNDYHAFSEQLEPLLKRYHGAVRHLGRAPSRSPDEIPPAVVAASSPRLSQATQRRKLESALKEAVTKERYEEAARLRDQLRQLGAGDQA